MYYLYRDTATPVTTAARARWVRLRYHRAGCSSVYALVCIFFAYDFMIYPLDFLLPIWLSVRRHRRRARRASTISALLDSITFRPYYIYILDWATFHSIFFIYILEMSLYGGVASAAHSAILILII